MARKSRTQPKQSTDTLKALSKVYKTAIYVRLSAEKDETRDRKTLINQRNLIKNFVDQQMDMEVYDIYMDDEISGTTFDRPEFERMMSDMRAGRINCIVVKDLSRLGRDYIETGNLVERVFPMMNIRFVAITDNYDSSKKDADLDREMILKEHHNDSRVIRQEQVYTEAVNKCVKEMDRLMELKSGLYADYTEELLDEKEYLQLNREYSQRIEKLKIQADEYRQAASQYESAEKTVAQLKAEMLRFKGKRKLTQEMVDLFVAQVRIYENKNLEIVLNYEDELKKFAELNMEREAG
ncbi:recombinase family protein [Roseburia intestinalis]|uniref:recombinase family protein n=1 Tax=Roseburia intestinalis TaxID=166486 RepID=UPI0032C0ED87